MHAQIRPSITLLTMLQVTFFVAYRPEKCHDKCKSEKNVIGVSRLEFVPAMEFFVNFTHQNFHIFLTHLLFVKKSK